MSGALPGSVEDSMEVGEQDTDQVAESTACIEPFNPSARDHSQAHRCIHKLNSEPEALRKDAREKEVG
ncbi:hypothetical protein Aduo_015224 [Ancylostoma duodenale]